MDLEFTADENDLRENVRAVLASACPPSLVRAVYEEGDRAEGLWKQMVDLDWPALAIAEEHGGIGMGFVEVGIVVDELGSAVAPSPYLATITQFVPAVRELGEGDRAGRWLAAVAAGELTGTLALAEQGRWSPEAIETVAREGADGRWTLHGTKDSVIDADRCTELVVIARAERSSQGHGLGAFVVPGEAVATRARRTIDPSLPVADVALDGVAVDGDRVLARPGDDVSARLDPAIDEATIALALSTVATCRAIFEQTLEYAKVREQYGRPIGSFQALKHRFADLYLAVERASSLCWFAVLTVAEDDARRAEAASLAKAAAGECQRLVASDGLQLHGGIGFTWEHDLHFWLKRAKTGEPLFGGAAHHRGRLAGMLGLAAPGREGVR